MDQYPEKRLTRSSMMSRSYLPEELVQQKQKYEEEKFNLEQFLKIIIFIMVSILVIVVFIYPWTVQIIEVLKTYFIGGATAHSVVHKITGCNKYTDCPRENIVEKEYSKYSSRDHDLKNLTENKFLEGTYYPHEVSITSQKLEFPMFQILHAGRATSIEEMNDFLTKNHVPTESMVRTTLDQFNELLPYGKVYFEKEEISRVEQAIEVKDENI